VQEGPSSGFAEMLKTKIMEVDQLQQGADEAMRKGAVAGATNIHETMVQLEEADIGMRMLLKVRDKALSAYQEIMRMQF
jgi:flagellar hook-basal body complex protein FliE